MQRKLMKFKQSKFLNFRRNMRNNQDQWLRSLLLMWPLWFTITCIIKKSWWMKGFWNSEKQLPKTRHFWMDVLHQWRVLQQLQKENGQISSCKQGPTPKTVPIFLLQNIVEWKHH
nr:hypothetical protein Iba_chr14dCG3860 [Ipomoea batatas]GME05855.1 hypothetical protein Iba_scaffold3501CG0120 [Ipomoea batatas]